MPWSSVMDDRLRFVARLLEGEQMSLLCREFGISRKTGYKIYDRYKECGVDALSDRSRRPIRYGNHLPAALESTIIGLKREKPHWGARKLGELLVRRLSGDVRIPARSTIHAVLDRHGLVKPGGKRRARAQGTALSAGANPNDLWCADFKGEFMPGNQRYCYPLTVTDHASPYLLLCEALESTKEEGAFAAFERLFRERGLPAAIRSDKAYVKTGEGIRYATAASIHKATFKPIVVAFDAGNLDHVVPSIQKQFPYREITIAADNDCWKEVNTGKLKAEAAAKKHSCKMALPEFTKTDTKPTDFNDLHCLEGLEEVASQLGRVLVPNGIPLNFFMKKDGLYWQTADSDLPPLKLCSSLSVSAFSHDEFDANHGLVLEWVKGFESSTLDAELWIKSAMIFA